jgi:hypothetical protein
VIVKVNVDRVTLPGALSPDEVRMLRTAVAQAVQQHVTRAADETQHVRRVSLGRASEALAAEVAAQCSRSNERPS